MDECGAWEERMKCVRCVWLGVAWVGGGGVVWVDERFGFGFYQP